MADCHIGGWRDPKLSDLSLEAFVKAIDSCIEKKLDFVLLSGDLFNTALPGIDRLKTVVEKLKELKDSSIPIYIIPGSHDFSPSGKTMLDVLESAGLCINVVKGKIAENRLKLRFTIDSRTGAKITGMPGRKGMLEKAYYEDLDKKSLEDEPGFKIFMLHTALTELKSKELEKMDSAPMSLLPRHFDYYAAGHVHERIERDEPGYGLIIYPGPLFPNNFRELESLSHGGFYIYDEGKLNFQPLKMYDVYTINMDCALKIPEEIESELMKEAKSRDFNKSIVTIRLAGRLKSGRISDIDFRHIFTEFYEKGAYFVMKNTAALITQEFEEVKVSQDSVEEIETSLVDEHIGQIKVEKMSPEKEKQITEQLMSVLGQGKKEGERNIDFEKRIINDLDVLLKGIAGL